MNLILITGSTGMVGKALVKLLKNYHLLTPNSKTKFKNINSINKYLKRNRPSILYI